MNLKREKSVVLEAFFPGCFFPLPWGAAVSLAGGGGGGSRRGSFGIVRKKSGEGWRTDCGWRVSRIPCLVRRLEGRDGVKKICSARHGRPAPGAAGGSAFGDFQSCR